MVNIRFRGVELEESAKSEEARRRNPTADAERELLDSVGEAYLSENANIGQCGSRDLHLAKSFEIYKLTALCFHRKLAASCRFWYWYYKVMFHTYHFVEVFI